MLEVYLGMQFGDEGKGKVVDATFSDWFVRVNGGANAGHTVRDTAVHQVPPGFHYGEAALAIAAGSVVDVPKLLEEIEALHLAPRRLFVSHQAHSISLQHKMQDMSANSVKIGTTASGNGPAYSDKALRIGEQIGSDERLLSRGISVTNIPYLLQQALKRGKSVRLVVAHGTMLDIDHGTYPYVTSSLCTVAGALHSAGLAPRLLDRVVGVAKVYTTRVAAGRMRGEFDESTATAIRTVGREFGTTTGRPRRIGRLDLGQLTYAAALNGPDEIILTKLDVLADMGPLEVVTGSWPAAGEYLQLPGWSRDDLRSWPTTSNPVHGLIEMVERATGAAVIGLGTGPGREDMIWRRRID